jgi:trehalose-phosphatase
VNDRRLSLALESISEIRESVGDRKPAFFLDLDGTLAPLVARPELVEVPAKTREVLMTIAERHLVCVISGRGLGDLQHKIGLDSVYYAADHGYRIVGPAGSGIDLEVGGQYRDELLKAARELSRRLLRVDGVVVEAKGLSLSVHYRLVAEGERPLVEQAVARVAQRFPALRRTGGKLVHEMRPPGAWNKGLAMVWLLERLELGRSDVCPICLGDDLTDEDMFVAADGWGVSVVVGYPGQPTRAGYLLRDSKEAAALLKALGTSDDYRSHLPG